MKNTNKKTLAKNFTTEYENLMNSKPVHMLEIPSKSTMFYLNAVQKLNRKFGNGITSPLCIAGVSGKTYVEFKTDYFKG